MFDSARRHIVEQRDFLIEEFIRRARSIYPAWDKYSKDRIWVEWGGALKYLNQIDETFHLEGVQNPIGDKFWSNLKTIADILFKDKKEKLTKEEKEIIKAEVEIMISAVQNCHTK